MTNVTPDKLERLKARLRELGSVAVAVSGGVDSMTLAFVAHSVDPETEMYHALSPAVPVQATVRVKRYAEQYGWHLRLIDAGEIRDPAYLENPANRCYFCKTNLYDTVSYNTERTVLSGTNTDDLGDYRPGLIAASEHRVEHPYVDVGIDKNALRKIASDLGLDDLAELPAAPCLSSRVTTGIRIEPGILPVINEAETALWESLQLYIPLKGVRCRIRPDAIAVEIETDKPIAHDADYAIEARRIVKQVFTRAGYAESIREVVVEPYQRGSAFLVETLEVD